MQHPLKSPDSSPKSSNFHMRVADIINLSEDENCDGDDCDIGEMTGFLCQPAEDSCGLACASPRQMVSRLMRRLKDRGRPAQWKERGQREKEMVVDQSRNLRCSLVETRFDRGEESALAGPCSGKTRYSGTGCCCCRKEAMSNPGGACSLFYLFAASKDELNKIRELRLEMQLLLHNAKEEEEEPWRKDFSGFEKVDSKESSGGSCLTNLKEEPSCSSATTSSRFDTFPPYHITREENNTIIMSGQSTVCCDQQLKKECSSEGMELLEAELEAELELLQFQLDAESSSSSQSMKVDSALATSEKADLNPRGEATTPEILRGGVPSIELERRLHELLESQQQEKIKELESAVECLKKTLTEKEREVSWWKDTALLVSRHVPEPPGGRS